MSAGRRALAPAALAGGFLALAVGAAPGHAALSWDLSLGAGVTVTDNLHLDPEPTDPEQRAPVSETIYSGVPSLRLAWDEGADRLGASYRGEYWSFSGDEELDPTWLHELAANGVWRRWTPFFLEAGAVRGRVPRFADGEGEALIDQIDRTFLTVRSGLAREWGPRAVAEIAYRGERETFSGVEDPDRVSRHSGEGVLRYRWSPLWGGELSAAYGKVGRELSADYSELRVAAAADRRLSERLVARGRLEWLRQDDDAVAAAPDAGAASDSRVRTTLLKSAELRGDLERGGFWSLRYEDRQEARQDGDTVDVGRAVAGSSLRARLGSRLDGEFRHETREYRISGREEDVWGPGLFARWVVAPWAALDLGGYWARTGIREVGREEVVDRALRVGAAVVCHVRGRALLEAGYVFRKNDSNDDTRSYEAGSFFAALTYYFRAAEPGTIPESSLARQVASSAPTTAGGR